MADHDGKRTKVWVDEGRAIAAQVGLNGPWDSEPNRVEWKHAGVPCLAVRNQFGAWCGYAAVPPGHPLHDCGHAFDLQPWMLARMRQLRTLDGHKYGLDLERFRSMDVYRDLPYVKAEVEQLAEQLAGMVQP